MRSRFSSLATALFALGCGADPQPGNAEPSEPGMAAMPSVGAGKDSSTSTTSAGSRATASGAGGAQSGRAGAAAMSASSRPAASSNAGSSGGAGATPLEPKAGAGAGSMAGTGAAPAAGSGENAAGVVAMAPGSAALSDMQTLIPDTSWDCGMAAGIPGPATGEPVFEIDFTVGEVHDLGQTQLGHRLQIDVSGGKVSGPKLDATLMDRGLDYQLTLDNGVVELEQIHILQVGGSPVYMRNCGLAPSATGPVRVVLDFEAPNTGSASWLNMGTFIGTREFDAAAKSLKMKVYQVSGMADKTDAVQIPAAPAGPHNTWACKKASGSKGGVVYQESVGIGGSVSVGDSKRGTRNIIPITGGSTTGKVPGTVLSGGADFQIIENGTFAEIDARYSVKTAEGEIIIVRNCGPLGGLVPVFETAKDGKYSWLNANTWLSSDPGLGIGAVNLTIYETM